MISLGSMIEIRMEEMSTHRIKRGEPCVVIWVDGPKGGSRGMIRIDRAEADKLLKAMARACATMEEEATGIISRR